MKYLFENVLLIGLNEAETKIEISFLEPLDFCSIDYSNSMEMEQAIRHLINKLEDKRKRERKPFWKRIFS